MADFVAPDIQIVGAGKDFRISICGPDYLQNPLPGSSAFATDLHIVDGVARVDLYGAVIPEQLVDGRIKQLGMIPEPLQLRRIFEQGQHAVVDQVTRRLVAGDQQQHEC